MSAEPGDSMSGTTLKRWLGVRHIQILLIFLGMILTQCTRTMMSVAIVAMTNPNNENHFDWSLQRQSVILSSFSWGYVVPQIFSGVLDRKFGGKNLMIIIVGFNSIFSLILPVAAIYGDWIMVCICRGAQGFTQSTIIATVTQLVAKWVPPNERGRTTSFVISGTYLAVSSQFIVSGYIASYWGWPMIFYVNGIAGMVWTLVYAFIGSDNPQVCKFISTEERLNIQSPLGQIGGIKKIKMPWKSILTSMPVYAVLMGNVGFSWGYWTLLTEIPTYMSKVLRVKIETNGVISAIPYITMFLMNFPVGFTSDYIIKKNWLSVTACRKIYNSFAFFGAALGLYCLTWVPAGNTSLAVVVLCITLGFKSGYLAGFIVNYLDLAHNFTSTLVALGNFAANFLGLFAPLFVGLVVKDETNPEDWYIVFYVSAMTYVVTNVFFIIFGSGSEQKWNREAEDTIKTINT